MCHSQLATAGWSCSVVMQHTSCLYWFWPVDCSLTDRDAADADHSAAQSPSTDMQDTYWIKARLCQQPKVACSSQIHLPPATGLSKRARRAQIIVAQTCLFTWAPANPQKLCLQEIKQRYCSRSMLLRRSCKGSERQNCYRPGLLCQLCVSPADE